MSFQNVDGQLLPLPVDYSLPGVMRYLQNEWQRNERDRIQWDLEKAEMKSRIAKLEGEKKGLQLIIEGYIKKIEILEASLNSTRYDSADYSFNEVTNQFIHTGQRSRTAVPARRARKTLIRSWN